MRPKDLKSIAISNVRGWVTNVDPVKQAEDLVEWVRGFRKALVGMVGERDWGTKHRFSSLPSNPTHNVEGASNASPIEVKITGHLFETGDYVDILSVGGNTAANGYRQKITKTDVDHFTIDGSVGTANWTSGGTVQLSMDFVGGTPLYLPAENLEYEVVASVDGRGHFGLWVRPVDESADWEELSKVYKATITQTPTDSETEVLIENLRDINNEPHTFVDFDLRYFIAYNVDKGNAAFLIEDSNPPLMIWTELLVGKTSVMGAGNTWEAGDDLVLYRMQGICDIDQGTLSTFFNQGFTPHVQWLVTEALNKVNLYLGSSAATPVMQYPLRIQKGTQLVNGQTLDINGHFFKMKTNTGWYIDLAELTPGSATLGTPVSPIRAITGTTPTFVDHPDETVELGDGIKVTVNFRTELNSTVGEPFHHQRWYVTALYRGLTAESIIQESDPIFRLYVSTGGNPGETMWEGCPVIKFNIALDLARCSKGLVGFRFYMAAKSSADLGANSPVDDGDLGTWADDPTQAGLVGWHTLDTGISHPAFPIKTASFTDPVTINTNNPHGLLDDDYVDVSLVEGNLGANGDWLVGKLSATGFSLIDSHGTAAHTAGGIFRMGILKDADSRYGYVLNFHFPSELLMSPGVNIVSSLGHVPDMSRTRLKPRFAAKISRVQGSPIAVDVDDRTVRCSCFNGDGVHMEDSFPDLTVDVNGFRTKFDVTGQGTLVGLMFSLNQLLAFKRSWLTLVDTQTSQFAGDYIVHGDRTVKADVASTKGIVESPIGVFWFGHNGIYLRPHQSEKIEIISDPIRNFIDGSMLTNDGTPYTTTEYREAVVAGYDPFSNDIWWNLEVNVDATTTEFINLRYHIASGRQGDEFGTWWVRTIDLSNGRIGWFSRRLDNTFTIGHSGGILMYPNIQSDFPYQDGVASDDSASDIGIETKMIFNLGTLAGLPNFGAIYEVELDCEGESASGNELFQMKIRPQMDEFLCETVGIPFDGKFNTRPIRVESIGKLTDATLELRLPAGLEYRFGSWSISTVTVWYTESKIKAS